MKGEAWRGRGVRREKKDEKKGARWGEKRGKWCERRRGRGIGREEGVRR